MSGKRVVHTNKNTDFRTWMGMVNAEMLRMGSDPESVNPLRHKHAWEGGDTPWGWADHITRKIKANIRIEETKRLNPET